MRKARHNGAVKGNRQRYKFAGWIKIAMHEMHVPLLMKNGTTMSGYNDTSAGLDLFISIIATQRQQALWRVTVVR